MPYNKQLVFLQINPRVRSGALRGVSAEAEKNGRVYRWNSVSRHGMVHGAGSATDSPSMVYSRRNRGGDRRGFSVDWTPCGGGSVDPSRGDHPQGGVSRGAHQMVQ